MIRKTAPQQISVFRHEEEGNLSDFACGWLSVLNRLAWVFKKTDLLGFPAQQSLRITEDDLKKKKYPVSGSPLGEKV